jgi:uncharacterized protein YecT (DUF1311 family)
MRPTAIRSLWVVFMLAAPAIGLPSPPAWAADNAAAVACAAPPTAAQSGCLEKRASAADARLNEVYRRAVSVADKSDNGDGAAWKAELKRAQQAWIAFRDADCGALIGYEWGHGTGMGAATEGCILDKTEQRTRELTQRYIERQ